MKRRASVTVFAALIFTTVSALLCALTESARTEGARFYVQTMTDASVDSLFSEYHRDLWELYRILGRETRDPHAAAGRLEEFMKPYVENAGWYAISAPEASVDSYDMLTDNGGAWFEQEVVDYMTFGWIDMGDLPESTEMLSHQVEQAQIMDSVLKSYGMQSREAAEMERRLTNVKKNISEQQELKRTARDQVRRGDNASFQHTADQLSAKVRALPNLILRYDEAADRFGAKLKELEEKHQPDLDRLDEENRVCIEEQTKEFRTYTDQDGERRIEVDVLDDNNENELSMIDRVCEFADETEEYIAEHEDDDDDEEEGNGGDGVDEDALWAEVAEAWDGVPVPNYNVRSGMGDPQKELDLEKIAGWGEEALLSIVIPPDRTIPEGEIDTRDFPSVNDITARNGDGPDLITSAAVCAYACKYLVSFTDNSTRPITCELEYALTGKDSDRSNLCTTVLEILAVREAFNFLGIVLNNNRRKQALKLAAEITGEGALPALTAVVLCLVITVWALTESLYDVRLLLEGKKCAIMKLKGDWMTAPTDVLLLAATGKLNESLLDEPSVGLSYESYIAFLLMALPAETRDYRVMDMIQANLVRSDEDFRIKNCLYGMHASAKCTSRHIFLSAGGGIPDGSSFGSFTVGAECTKAY